MMVAMMEGGLFLNLMLWIGGVFVVFALLSMISAKMFTDDEACVPEGMKQCGGCGMFIPGRLKICPRCMRNQELELKPAAINEDYDSDAEVFVRVDESQPGLIYVGTIPIECGNNESAPHWIIERYEVKDFCLVPESARKAKNEAWADRYEIKYKA